MTEASLPAHDTHRPVYLIDGSRSPFLKARGRPGPFKAAELAVRTARPLLLRQSFAATQLDEVILGCVGPGPEEANIARIAALRLGCGDRVPAWTVQRNCASGLQAVDAAFRGIQAGSSELVLAGGVEAMSHTPILVSDAMVTWLSDWQAARSAGVQAKLLARLRPMHLAPVLALLKGLTDPVVGLSMGQTAEKLAYRFGITRPQMDRYAVASHQRLARAQQSGMLNEIEPMFDAEGHVYDHDDGVRPDSTVDKLATLKPAFDKPYGQVTAGNSAQITDGTAWVILASEAAVERHHLTPLARLVDSQWAGVDPTQMGLGPVHAVAPLLQRHALSADRIDYWELNEAFAAQVLACLAAWADPDYCCTELGLEAPVGQIPHERLNVDGGGISLGHPVGASGARIVLHLAQVLSRHNAKRGIATLCIGGGQGGAMLIERAA